MSQDTVLIKYYGGSHAYGTNTPASDIDYRGIYVSPLNHYLSPNPNKPDQIQYIDDEEDVLMFDLDKFATLVLKGNPNIIEALWVGPDQIIEEHPAFSILRELTKDLLTKDCVNAHYQYGLSQLRRMKNHKKWINCEQTERPQQKDHLKVIQSLDLTLFPLRTELNNENAALFHFGNDIYGIYQLEGSTIWRESDGTLTPLPNSQRVKLHDKTPYALVKFVREEYVRRMDLYKGYKDWESHRNEKRHQLEVEHGYDTKHASHLIRLIRMAKEAIDEGKVHLPRPDSDFLRDVKDGKYSYEEVLKFAEDDQAYINAHVNKLPPVTNELREKVYEATVKIKREVYGF